MASSPLLKNLIENNLTLIALEITRKGPASIKRIEREAQVNLKTETLTPDDIDKLKEFELDHAETLLKNTIPPKKWALNWELNGSISAILAVGVLLIMFFLFRHIISLGEIQDSTKEVIIYVLGVFSAIVTQVFSFYFGSSAGSQAKSATLAEQATRKEEDSLSKP